MTLKFFFVRFGLSWGKFWPLCTLWPNIHMFLDYLPKRDSFFVWNPPSLIVRPYAESSELSYSSKIFYLFPLAFPAGTAKILSLMNSYESKNWLLISENPLTWFLKQTFWQIYIFFKFWTVVNPQPLELMNLFQDWERGLSISYHLVLNCHTNLYAWYFFIFIFFYLNQPFLVMHSPYAINK